MEGDTAMGGVSPRGKGMLRGAMPDKGSIRAMGRGSAWLGYPWGGAAENAVNRLQTRIG